MLVISWDELDASEEVDAWAELDPWLEELSGIKLAGMLCLELFV